MCYDASSDAVGVGRASGRGGGARWGAGAPVAALAQDRVHQLAADPAADTRLRRGRVSQLEHRRRRSRPRHHQQGARAAEAVPVAPAPVNARLSAAEIAALTQGQLVGAADVTVTGVAPIDRAGPDDLSFLASKRYLPYF